MLKAIDGITLKLLTAAGCLVLITATVDGQKTKQQSIVKLISISQEYSLGFKSYNAKWQFYYKPFIIRNGRQVKIIGFDDNNGTDTSVKVSPSKKFIVISSIAKGYVGLGKEKVLHENALCVIVALQKAKVVSQMQSACGGEWNEKNEWIDGGKVIFSAD